MIATENTQSIAEFRESAAGTIERLNQTGEPEYIPVDGEARAVVLSPAAYATMAREISSARDAEVNRRSLQQYRAGEGQELHAFSADLRAKLIAAKDGQPVKGAE
jgi:PHD/YefM family antitoxin component YafN of YafNO toxin-antitoxin module